MLKVKIKKKINDFNLDIDFETNDQILGLFGELGSGKSLTLKCIAGIINPDEGYIEFNNRILFDSDKKINLSPQDRHIGYLFQNLALFPQMSVAKNILVSINKKHCNDEKNSILNEILELLHIKSLENRFPSELSYGQQQRVAIARIIVNEPELLLLDEPFSSLDSYLKWSVARELKSIINRINKNAIFVSHNINEVYFLCNNAIVLSNGKEVEKGEVKLLVNSPKNDITKRLVEYSFISKEDIDNWSDL